MTNYKKKKTLFIAGNHCLHFGKYKGNTSFELIDIDPVYLKWCIDNLKHLRFDGKIKERLNLKLDKITN